MGNYFDTIQYLTIIIGSRLVVFQLQPSIAAIVLVYKIIVMSKLLLVPTILRITLIIGLIGIAVIANTQSVAINNNGASANSSAMLDVSSTTKGILIPRMRTIERTAIAGPAEGLLVYDNDTRSFWYYSNNSWNEMPKSMGGGGTPTGPASGDLSGSYPSPNVVKIQNLDVAFGVPFDKQIMKWDMLNNRWKGENDSLFLPYNSTFGSPTKLFGITNTNTSNGATAIYGKSGNAGSGINPGALTIGVWGDNSSGPGVMGTSNNHVGTYGYSVNNHGTYGFTSGVGFAGVYGGRVNNGPAVMGEVYSAGFGIYGKSNGTSGKAALFETIHPSNTDTAAKFSNKGLGVNSYFINDNTSNTGALINGEHFGQGGGIYMKLWNAQNNYPGFYMYQYGNGDGLYVGSNKSKVARFYANGGNADTALTVAHDGTGTGLQINLTSGLNTKNAVDVVTEGTGNAAKFVIDNASNSSAAVSINTNGTGRGLQSTISNLSNLAAAIHGSGTNKGVEGFAQNIGVLGQSTSMTGGIGVFGQSSLNSLDGIGMKGISYSTNNTSGAVTGINNATGIGVYGESTGGGTGIYGRASTTFSSAIIGENSADNAYGVTGYGNGTDGIGIVGIAGQNNAQSVAGFFTNLYANNSRSVVEILNTGTGNNLFVNNSNAASSSPLVRIKNGTNGKSISLQDDFSVEKFSVTKAGNVVSAGTVTVKNSKGIVRNSTSTQLRVETMLASLAAGGESLNNGWYTYISVTFSTAFSSPPVVYVGNITTPNYLATFLTTSIMEVTTTGCKLILRNTSGGDLNNIIGTWQVVAMGAE